MGRDGFAPLELVGTLVGYGPRSFSEWGGFQGDGRIHLWTIGTKASDAMLSGSHRNARGGANAARLQRSGHKVSWGDSHGGKARGVHGKERREALPSVCRVIGNWP